MSTRMPTNNDTSIRRNIWRVTSTLEGTFTGTSIFIIINTTMTMVIKPIMSMLISIHTLAAIYTSISNMFRETVIKVIRNTSTGDLDHYLGIQNITIQ